jgi:two-component system sensor histidine kinase BarA
VLIKPFDEAQLLRALTPKLARELVRPPGPSRLAQDAELLELLREELPLQLKELEDAFTRGDAVAARAAAHTLNGTAAFYQLAQLKAAASDMEEQLAASAFSGVVAGGLPRLRAALYETLGGIGGAKTAEPIEPA